MNAFGYSPHHEIFSPLAWNSDNHDAGYYEKGWNRYLRMNLTSLRPLLWALLITFPLAGCKGADPNLQLKEAIERDDAFAVKQAIKQGADLNSYQENGEESRSFEVTPLRVAVSQRKTEAALALIESKANVNHRGSSGEAVLGIALDQRELRVMEALLDAGADVNIPYTVPPSMADGQMLLARAVESGRVEKVELLLKYKAKPDAPDTYGRSAYWHTGGKLTPAQEAALPSNQRRIRQLLRQAGAKPDPRDYKGRTPAEVAKAKINYHEEINTDRLRAYTDRSHVGIDSNNLTNRVGTKAKLKLAKRPKDLAAQAQLFQAIVKNDAKAMQKALQGKAEINAALGKASGSRYENDTPLILAINKGHTNLVVALLKAGADSMTSSGGWPPLHHAARMGDPVMVKALLDKGAEPNYGTYGAGEVALLHGVHSGSIETVRLLLARGANPHAIPEDASPFENEEAVLKMLSKARKTYKPKG